MATATIPRIQMSDLDELWSRSEADLELDPETGRITQPSPSSAVRDVARAAAPVAGAAAIALSAVPRWD